MHVWNKSMEKEMRVKEEELQIKWKLQQVQKKAIY